MTSHKLELWKIENDRVILASESEWQKPLKWEHIEGQLNEISSGKNLEVTLQGDPFAEWPEKIELDFYDDSDACVCDGCGEIISYIGNCENAERLCDKLPHKASQLDILKRLFTLIDQTPNLIWQIETEFPERALELWQTERRKTPSYGGVYFEDCVKQFRNIHLTIPSTTPESVQEQLRGLVGTLTLGE